MGVKKGEAAGTLRHQRERYQEQLGGFVIYYSPTPFTSCGCRALFAVRSIKTPGRFLVCSEDGCAKR